MGRQSSESAEPPPSESGCENMMAQKVIFIALALVVMASAVSINTADLKEAMAEAEDTDTALEWTRDRLKSWGGDYKKILKKMPPLQMLARAENRLAAAKQDVHEAQTSPNGIKRAQLEDLAQELTEEAQHQLEATKEVD